MGVVVPIFGLNVPAKLVKINDQRSINVFCKYQLAMFTKSPCQAVNVKRFKERANYNSNGLSEPSKKAAQTLFNLVGSEAL